MVKSACCCPVTCVRAPASYMSACDFLANSSKCDGNMVVTPLRNTVRVFRIRCPFDGTKKMTEIQHF